MNIKHQARGGFTKFPDDELLVQASTVLQAMDGNANFPTPTPDLAEVTAARDDFSAKLAIARKRSGPEETSAKNDARLVLADLLKRLAFYVSTTANGNLTVLLSSGFRATAYPQQGRVPAQPFGALLARGRQSGQLVFSVYKVVGALYYEYRYGTKAEGDAEPQWGEPFVTTSSVGNVIAPATETVRYYAQARACNGYGKSEWSEPASCIAL
ncbi:hypothetical protein [Parapedobacter tibetensis]|uniref:hypothetical protein n=1 Tax=Parapedobacter tibetensis TaxID=2972951 RepID=UPI00214DF081|nr:hypothetical protein [Parapedobacter tibetensis]